MAKTEMWSYSAGERGRKRVRAFEHAATGVVMLEFYHPEPGESAPRRRRVSTGHRDRNRAKRQADELAAGFGKGEAPPPEELTLRALLDIYLVEVTPQKKPRTQQHDRAAAEMFARFFGPNSKPKTLNRRDWDRFIRERREGRIAPAALVESSASAAAVSQQALRPSGLSFCPFSGTNGSCFLDPCRMSSTYPAARPVVLPPFGSTS